MNDGVHIESHAGIPLAVVRRLTRQVELSRVVPEACGLVWSVLKAQNVSGIGRHVAIYLDHRMNVEIGVELDHPFPGHGEVVGSTTPTGFVATTAHFGPYGEIHRAHSSIRNWCQLNGHRLAGPCWEAYGHWQPNWNDNPALIRTDVYYLLTAEKRL